MPRLLLSLALIVLAAPALAAAEVGEPAPDFSATDINGQTFDLAAQRGKIVVLEWTNPGCPFVRKHYGNGSMQAAQQKAAEAGAVWVSVNSSATGKQGAVSDAQARAWVAEQKAAPAHYVLDPSGAIGRLYGAKTTPHMFVIAADGRVAYAGAVDDDPSPKLGTDRGGTHNYVLTALADLAAARAVAEPETRPYGCGVKY